jgi:hypothetical protein
MEHDATQKDWWMSPDATPVSALSRRALLLVPLGIGAMLGTGSWLLFDRLQRGDDQSLAPPSPLIGKQLPAFALPGQMPSPGFSSADVIAAGRPVLLSFMIDASGIVRWHWAGGLSEKVVHRLIEPLLQRRA